LGVYKHMYVLKMKSGLFVYIYGMLQCCHKNNCTKLLCLKYDIALSLLFHIFTIGKTSS
jgi:hypothetical protein